MKVHAMFRSLPAHAARLACLALVLSISACASAQVVAPAGGTQPRSGSDARIGLRPGVANAGVAAHGLELVGHRDRSAGFFNPSDIGDFLYMNSDMAFKGNTLFVGNFNGFQIYDVTDARNPQLRTGVVCPGGQGDVSVHGNLLFMSVEMPNGRLDCGPGELSVTPSAQRFLGVRIFDITNLAQPKQVAAVQTCRGSHTHTLVPDRRDPAHVYIYVAGTSTVRPTQELAGCVNRGPEDPNTARFRIEVIRVPVAAPQNATIVNTPRIFADPQSGSVSGLWQGGAHGPGTQTTAATDQCHDITAFPEIGIAAGACAGNGIILDISDPANPKRIDEVSDPNFAYWHSATFNHDGSKVIFTDEWGGGVEAFCRSNDPRNWGANAIFDRVNGRLRLRSYYKLPAPQSETENCVAHNGSLVPVPGRDIMVQGWYQGGISVFDFTDSARPVEIAYFDRGPMNASELQLGGSWSAYYYNGQIYSSEIGRGIDILRLLPTDMLTQNEIDAAALVRFDTFNAQTQPRVTWPAHFTVARAYLDQLRRENRVPAARVTSIATELDRLERLTDAAQKRSGLTQLATTVAQLETETRAAGADRALDAQRLAALTETIRGLAR